MSKEKLLSRGLWKADNRNGFTVLKLHYSADDDKTQEWATNLKKSYPSIDIWNQEMELDFTKASGRRVYPEFRSDLHVASLSPIPHHDIWRGWDFGYHHPAVVWAQVDSSTGRLNVLAELLGEEIVINRFAEDVLRLSKAMFPGYTFMDAGDPAVRAKSDKSEKTTADILRTYGIRIQYRNTLIKDGINMMRNLLLTRPDGTLKFKIDNKCSILVDGFMGGYTRNDEDEPEKDGYYEHIFDALRYLLVILYNPRTLDIIRPSHLFAHSRPTASRFTGY